MIRQLQQQIGLYGTYLNAKNNQLSISQPIVINYSEAMATAFSIVAGFSTLNISKNFRKVNDTSK